mgnify:CR=1 FL=1
MHGFLSFSIQPFPLKDGNSNYMIAWGAGGRRFESCHPSRMRGVAQWIERRYIIKSRLEIR